MQQCTVGSLRWHHVRSKDCHRKLPREQHERAVWLHRRTFFALWTCWRGIRRRRCNGLIVIGAESSKLRLLCPFLNFLHLPPYETDRALPSTLNMSFVALEHCLHFNVFNSDNCFFVRWGKGEQPKGGPSTIPDFNWIQRILGNSRERRSIQHVHGHRTSFIRIGTGCQPCPRSIDVNHEMIVFWIDIRLMSEAMNNNQNWITDESESSYTTTNNYNNKENIIRTNNPNASSRKFVWTLANFVSCTFPTKPYVRLWQVDFYQNRTR